MALAGYPLERVVSRALRLMPSLCTPVARETVTLRSLGHKETSQKCKRTRSIFQIRVYDTSFVYFNITKNTFKFRYYEKPADCFLLADNVPLKPINYHRHQF